MEERPKRQAKKKIIGSDSDENPEEPELFQEDKQNPTLYDLLQVSKDAETSEIKKSYRTLALKLHPDKNQDDPEATKSFQKLNEAYQILINPEKRKLYDETGSTGEDDSAGFAEAYSFYRNLYKKIEKEDIENFESKYKNSDEEAQDVIKYYVDHKGDLTHMLEAIILSRNEDVPRFIQLIEEKIEKEEVRRYKNFDNTKNKIKVLADEGDELEQDLKKQKEAESLKQLTSAIMLRGKDRFGSLLDQLEQKYATKGKGKKGGKAKKSEYDIDEEAFNKIQAQRSKKVKK